MPMVRPMRAAINTMASCQRLSCGLAIVVVATLPFLASAGGGDPNFKWDGGEHCPEIRIQEIADHLAEKREIKRMTLIMFHVSWCGVCQATFPRFVAASEQAVSKGIEVDFAHVDCEKAGCAGYIGRGYPTIKLFPGELDAENRTYKSQRTTAAFIKYAERMTAPAVRGGLSREDFEKALDNETLSGYVVAESASKALPLAVRAAAKKWMDLHIFAASKSLGDLLPKGTKVPEGARLAVYARPRHQWAGHDSSREAAPAVEFFEGDIDDEVEVAEWVEKKRFVGMWKLDETNFYEFTHANRKAVLLAEDPAQATKATEDAFRGTAADMGEEFLFGVINGDGWKEELADFNIYHLELPRILVTDDNFDTWLEDVDKLRVESLTQDLRGILDGSGGVLRQTKSTMSRLWFWHRAGIRIVKNMLKHAEEGPVQASIVAVEFLALLAVVGGVLWGLYVVVCIIFSDPEEEEERLMGKKADARKLD